jgi:hypothetical protein
MRNIRFPQDPLQPFQAGNVWKMKDSSVCIGDVGRLLVNYRHYKGQNPNGPKGPNTLTSKRDLEKFLIENKAVLVQE